MPVSPEVTNEAGFLHLLFEQAERKIHIVIFYLNDEHGVTSDVAAGRARPAVLPG